MREKTRASIKFFSALALLILGMVLLFHPLKELFSNLQYTRNLLNNFGFAAPLALIFLFIAQSFLALIPGQFLGILSGYFFGIPMGIIYAMLGLTIGSLFVFLLSRRFGRPFAEKIISSKNLDRFDDFIKRRGSFALFMIYLLPFLPDSAMSYVAGLTKIRLKTFMLVSFFGRLPAFIILGMVGAGFASGDSVFSIILLGGVLLFSVIVYFNRRHLENLMLRIVRKNLKKN